METKAIVRGVRLSVDKGRLVADLIRGKKVDQALNILEFTQKKARWHHQKGSGVGNCQRRAQ
jgi:large subunit ribosomal protein L22